MLKVGIVGAAGYAGAELVRIISRHPEFELAVITSNADAGNPISDVYPAFEGLIDLTFSRHDDPALFDCNVVFLATPHTVAMKQAPSISPPPQICAAVKRISSSKPISCVRP
jgi:N-acetyl-gamma-glutamyl-phosphate reductase